MLSAIQALCLTQTITHQKYHAQPKGEEKKLMPQKIALPLKIMIAHP